MPSSCYPRGASRVYPKDVDMNLIMTNMVNIIRRNNGLEELA